jgi:D-threo-aldose 1-dehydrogenase
VGGALIETRPVGNTGIELTRIGFGGAPIGDIKRAPSDTETRKLLDTAWDAGIRYFDVAPMYGAGLAERRLGDFLREKPRDEYVLSTKVGRLLVPDRAQALERYGDRRAMPFRYEFDFTYSGIMRSFEHSIQRLGLERIDILYLHDLGRFSQGPRHDETMRQALDGGGIRALTELRASGAVKAIGAGVNEWPILDELMNHAQWDVFLLANRYTLLDQEVLDTFFPRCRREGVVIVDGAPLNAGLLALGSAMPKPTYDYRPATDAIMAKVRGLEAVCARYHTPLVRAALAFPLGNDLVASIIPGFSIPSDLEQNLGQYREAIPPELWADLKAAGLLHPDAPVPVTPII